jgi:hypothetical protein
MITGYRAICLCGSCKSGIDRGGWSHVVAAVVVIVATTEFTLHVLLLFLLSEFGKSFVDNGGWTATVAITIAAVSAVASVVSEFLWL